jgi:uncharacterized protein Smg (DUF494 family)
MKERVVELLVLLMTEIQGNKQLTDIDVSLLRERGFSHGEISAAFSWLHDHMPTDQGRVQHVDRSTAGSRRVLHDAERMIFSTEGQGYLILLQEFGLLDQRDIEAVIERAMITGYENLSVGELREIVASFLFAKQPSQGGSSHIMLNNEDSIH